ncbi:MAG: bifunctional N(6)-L-threonylcarbamoyladenine synthase/serine/threonine protein kinase [Candidatus Altiarchaeota archaeon]
MITLGIEGTAHTMGVGLVEGTSKVLSDIRKTFQPEEGKGIHPRDAAQFLGESMGVALDEALRKAGVGFDNVDLIAFSQGPGLGPCLRTAATGARVLALKYKKPMLGVNHCVAHIAVGKIMSGFKNPLVLYVSGANTQILELKEQRYRIFGETLDVGIGNMLDKFGRETGLNHPAGPKIESLAKQGKNYVELPYTVKGTDLSFSGILTNAISKFKNGVPIEDICFSLQETSFAMLCEVTERALAHLKAGEVILTGGVGNNSRLCEMLSLMAGEHDARFSVPKGFCSDNGAMIAMLAALEYNAGVRMNLEETIVKPKQRTDDVEIFW